MKISNLINKVLQDKKAGQVPGQTLGQVEKLRDKPWDKKPILSHYEKLKNRLRELIGMYDNSKALTLNRQQIDAISAEGTQIIDQLPGDVVLAIFKNSKVGSKNEN